MSGLRATAALLVALVAVPAMAAGVRSYSLSLEVRYGDEPSRASYLDDIRRVASSWLHSTGPFDAPSEKGKADLHLRITFHKIEVDRKYPQVSGEENVLFDTPTAPAYGWSTLFVTEVAVVDPLRDDATIVEKPISVYNEQVQSERVLDPRQYSWDENVEFLLDRVHAFLQKKNKRIRRYLEQNPRDGSG